MEPFQSSDQLHPNIYQAIHISCSNKERGVQAQEQKSINQHDLNMRKSSGDLGLFGESKGEFINIDVLDQRVPFAGTFLLVSFSRDSDSDFSRQVSDSLVPDELVELGVNSNIASLHHLGDELSDFGDCSGSLLLELNSVSQLVNVYCLVDSDFVETLSLFLLTHYYHSSYDYKYYQLNSQIISPSFNASMIQAIYNEPARYTYHHVLWVALQFININYLIFFAFTNVCFQNLVSKPSVPVISISLCLLVSDFFIRIYLTAKLLSKNTLLDLIVIGCLCVSFSLYNMQPDLVFLQIVTLIKMWDVFRFNVLVYNLCKKNNFAFKLYVVLKIVYWIILSSHILGCLFYALDYYLIKTQYFGFLGDNAFMYYQARVKAYSPIYSLSEPWRYVYAVYYSYSLVSTVAFGDIIGENYFENIMVGAYIIMATIGIGLIIEQMYIVFRKQKHMYYLLVNRIKYLSEYIRSQPHIRNEFRHDLMNYIVSSQWKQITGIPNLEVLTPKLQAGLYSSSILSETEDKLPLIIRMYFLMHLKSKFYPANYNIVDNNFLECHIHGRIILNAQVEIGCTYQMFGKRNKKASSVAFGFEELILGTNYLNRGLTVRTKAQAQVFTLSDIDFQVKMSELKAYVNQDFATPKEFFQISKDKAMFESQTQCLYCQSHQHSLINCPYCHYVPSVESINGSGKFGIQKRRSHKRGRKYSKKNTSMKSLSNLRADINKTLEVPFSILGKVFQSHLIFKNSFQKVISQWHEDKTDSNEEGCDYYSWKIYAPQGNL